MTGLDGQRVYLDWNATAPLRPEARTAMLEAMDVVGNPSSVHAEGRAAKAIVEKARGQVADLVGCEPDEIVFTSGATEANNWVFASAENSLGRFGEHESSNEAAGQWSGIDHGVGTDRDGSIDLDAATAAVREAAAWVLDLVSFEAANGETGRQQDIGSIFTALRQASVVLNGTQPPNWPDLAKRGNVWRFRCHSDVTQLVGKRPFDFSDAAVDLASMSAHKLGGPKGVGALLVASGLDVKPMLSGGGQEKGRRSGTENVIGIAGFGAAAEAARRDLKTGFWDAVENLRNLLEERLAEAAPDTIFFCHAGPRLPNTSCFATPGWAGETQVMQMDLAGFAISAGSACSSGKVKKTSRALLAMGFDETTASSAIRVSMGPTTTEAEVMAFADAWTEAYRRRRSRAA